MGLFRRNRPNIESALDSLDEETRSLSVAEGSDDELALAEGTAAGVFLSQETVMAIPAFYSGCRVLCDSIATLPAYLVPRGPGAGNFNGSEFDQPEWLDEPNPVSTRADLFSDIMLSLLLDGNAFVMVVADPVTGDPQQLHVLDPTSVVMLRNGLGEPRFGVPLVGEGNRYANLPRASRATTVGILHIAGMRQPGKMRGLSVVQACAETLGVARASTRYQASLYRNSAVPFGVVEVSSTMSKEEAVELLKKWRLGRSGPGRAGIPAILSGGASWKPLTLSPADMQLLEAMKFSVRDVARLLRLPLSVLGDDATTSYASVEQELQSLGTYSILPWVVRVELAFQRVLRSDEALKLNLDALARADMKSRYDAYAVGITNSVLSPNEARASEGRPPVKGGDKLWRQMNLEELDAPDVEPPATEPPATDPPETDPPDPETPPTDEATK